MELCSDVREEFDMLEVIQDSIKEVFDCDLDCKTCSSEEQGQCMQAFKVGNLLLLRKLQQDEYIILDFIQNVEDIMNLTTEWKDALDQEQKERELKAKKVYRKGFEKIRENKNKIEDESFYI